LHQVIRADIHARSDLSPFAAVTLVRVYKSRHRCPPNSIRLGADNVNSRRRTTQASQKARPAHRSVAYITGTGYFNVGICGPDMFLKHSAARRFSKCREKA
ncbi:MAG: hypothetical protein ACLQMV_00785, partial [Rhodoblastus sp.]|uniref:hypothetical protein n=1 Tax=Rhodoblastus sp. TaxID=1962975 RepID=UPI003FD83BA7